MRFLAALRIQSAGLTKQAGRPAPGRDLALHPGRRSPGGLLAAYRDALPLGLVQAPLWRPGTKPKPKDLEKALFAALSE
jgi:hypothetical protein